MKLVIIAARNRTKSFNELLAGKSPCRWQGLVSQLSKVRRRFGTGFTIWTWRLECSCPCPVLEIIQRSASQWDPRYKPARSFQATRNPATGQYANAVKSGKERERDSRAK